MCTTAKNPLELYALKALNHPQSARRSTAANGAAFARFVGDDKTEFFMKQTRVTVGRSSARSAADVDMGDSSFISRNHLEIYLDQTKFFVLVTGKNGIFVDDAFHKKGSPPVELPLACELRFPSTDIRLQFEAFPEAVAGSATPGSVPQTLIVNCHDVSEETVVSTQGEDLTADAEDDSEIETYVEETESDIVETNVCTEVVPISLETEEIWTPNQSTTAPQQTAGSASAARQNHFNQSPAFTVPTVVTSVNRGSIASTAHSTVASHSRGPRDEAKPPYSYAQLIVQAIMSTVDKQLTLSGIYAYITHNYPYYKATDKGWQNSIRHNLSLNRYFIKVARSQEESGKGSFWRVDPTSEAMLVDQAFRRRRQRGSGVGLAGGAGAGGYIKSSGHMELVSSSDACSPEDSLSWDDQSTSFVGGVEEMTDGTVSQPITAQQLRDLNWVPAAGMGQTRLIQVDHSSSNVVTLSGNTVGTVTTATPRNTIYTLTIQQDGSVTQQAQRPTSVQPGGATTFRSNSLTAGTVRQVLAATGNQATAAGTVLPPITILQTGNTDVSASLASAISSQNVLRYITSLAQGSAIKQAVLMPRSAIALPVGSIPTSLATVSNGTSVLPSNGQTIAVSSAVQTYTSVLLPHHVTANGTSNVGFLPTDANSRKRPASSNLDLTSSPSAAIRTKLEFPSVTGTI